MRLIEAEELVEARSEAETDVLPYPIYTSAITQPHAINNQKRIAACLLS